MKKDIILLLLASYVIMLIPSCLGNDDVTDSSVYKDAQISSFVLSHDSVGGLAKVAFTIDQINGRIFNIDSLPFGTVIDKVICTLTYSASAYLTVAVSGTQVVQEALGDSTITWNGTDSLNFFKPVHFTVYAIDGVSRKTYTASVNIHKVQPDSMVWRMRASSATGVTADEQKVISLKTARLMYKKTGNNSYRLFTSMDSDATIGSDAMTWKEDSLESFPADANVMQITPFDNAVYMPTAAGKLFRSADGRSWTELPNCPEIKTLLGSLRSDKNKSSLLSAIVKQDNVLYFTGMTAEGEWKTGEAVPENFPVSGFGSANYERIGFEYLMTAAGKSAKGDLLNTVWATSNATQWALFTRAGKETFTEREGAMLALYDDKFFLFGGIDREGTGLKDIYLSFDNGIIWAVQDSIISFPDEYKGRGYASIEVDSNNYVYIYGGKTAGSGRHVDEIWRGRINRLGFGKEK